MLDLFKKSQILTLLWLTFLFLLQLPWLRTMFFCPPYLISHFLYVLVLEASNSKTYILTTFLQLPEPFSLPKIHLFKYLQIHTFVRHKYAQFPILPEEIPLDDFLAVMKGMISHIYSQILGSLQPPLTL